MKIGEKIYVEAELLTLPDRMDDVKVKITNTSKRDTDVECSVYNITANKPNTEAILRMLDFKYKTMLDSASSYEEKELITKIFKEYDSVVRIHQ